MRETDFSIPNVNKASVHVSGSRPDIRTPIALQHSIGYPSSNVVLTNTPDHHNSLRSTGTRLHIQSTSNQLPQSLGISDDQFSQNQRHSHGRWRCRALGLHFEGGAE
jgi:hypothetical protein